MLVIKIPLQKIFLSLAGLFALLFLGLNLFWGYEILSLKSRFVESHYEKSKRIEDKLASHVRYQYVKKRPAHWVSIKKVPKHVYGAIVVSEDWGFFKHIGFDFGQLRQALADYYLGGKLRGASTISQQLVKNLFLSNERSLLRKLKEAYLTVMLEAFLDKKKILEVYLNVIEYGEGLYGLGRASQFYFSKSAFKMNPREAAFMAMLLPNPKRYSESFRKKELTEYAKETMGRIMVKMRQAHFISSEVWTSTKDGPLIWESSAQKIEFDLDYYSSSLQENGS